MKHTPGPWDSKLVEGEYIICGSIDDHRHVTAICRREGNANLIAAAPEMYTWAEDLLSRLLAREDVMFAIGADARDSVRMLGKALKKVRGES